MEFMFLFLERSGAPEPTREGLDEMAAYSAELARKRKLRRGGPLAPVTQGARVRVRDSGSFVSDGPFAESKEFVAGFWIVEAADRAEALELGKKCPHARGGAVEIHALQIRLQFPDRARGTPFLLAFLAEPGAVDPDRSRGREMAEFGRSLDRGIVFETAPLASEPRPARVEVRGERALVTDGPFAETKEAIAGYALVYQSTRANALALAARFPHARWGTVEVREILFFDPT